MPTSGLTLGIADLLDSRAILVLARGAAKATIVRAAIEGAPGAHLPASWLQTHAEVTWTGGGVRHVKNRTRIGLNLAQLGMLFVILAVVSIEAESSSSRPS